MRDQAHWRAGPIDEKRDEFRRELQEAAADTGRLTTRSIRPKSAK